MRGCVLLLLVAAAQPSSVPPSPRIESLKDALRQQQAGAVEAFWTEISRSGGTPLVECPAGLRAGLPDYVSLARRTVHG